MSRPAILLREFAILIHRWMGVGFCLLFAAWFVSGIVMMYCDFPLVSAEQRLAKSPALDGSRIRLSPSEAYTKLDAQEAPAEVRVATVDGRPVYRFRFKTSQMGIFADNGDLLDTVPSEMARRIA